MASLYLWALFASLFASAQISRPLDLDALGSPTFESFGPRDGLPDGVLTGIAVDREGFAWATSPQGIYRFIGHRWEKQLGEQAGRIHRRMINTSDGELWIPSQDLGISRWDGQQWHFDRVDTNLPTDTIYTVAETTHLETGERRRWLLSVDAGLYFQRDGQWIADPGNSSLPDATLLALATTTKIFGESRQWIATGTQGLWYRSKDSQWQLFTEVPDLIGQIEDLKVINDVDGEALWISNFSVGVFRMGEQGVRSWTQDNSAMPSNVVYSMAVDETPEGRAAVWVASRKGVVRIQGGRVESFDRRHGLPSNQVRGVWLWEAGGGEKVLWLATEAGAARTVFIDDRWRNASLLGSDGLGVFGVFLEPDGVGSERLWVASHGDGLGLFTQGQWQVFNRSSGHLPTNNLRMVRRMTDLEGQSWIWVGLEGGGVMRISEEMEFRPFDAPWPYRSGQILMDMTETEVLSAGRRERELWFASRLNGVYRLSANGWTGFGVDPGWETTAVLAQTDSQGRSWIWVTTQSGLMRFHDGRFERVEGTPSGRLLGLTLSEEGGRQVLWIGSAYSGLGRLDVTDPLSPVPLDPAELPPPIHSAVYGAQLDSVGRVYVCTNDGVQQLTPTQNGGWSERVFRRKDGMIHEECNTNAQLVDQHDRFWTGTLGGLTVFSAGDDVESSAPRDAGTLHVVRARVDGDDVRVDAPVIATDDKRIELEYYLQGLHREEETRYRIHIVGLDSADLGWTRENRRTFSRLPPGEYTVLAEAMDYNLRRSAPVSVDVIIEPHLFQHPLVRMLIAVLVLACVSGMVLWRISALRRQKEFLETEVAQRTAELNDANRKLEKLSYTDSLTGLANRRHFMESVRSAIRADTALCALIFMDVDHFKRFNDQYGHPAGDEALRCVAAVLNECMPEEAVAARYGGEEFACFLPDTSPESAAQLAETIRCAIERKRVSIPGQSDERHITVSLGIASCQLISEEAMQMVLRNADKALYRAKGKGRNRVEIS